MLKGRKAAPVLHANLLARLAGVGRTYRILMIKTNLAFPYTSVFLELDCGYWPAESEAQMREQMKNAAPLHPSRKVRPPRRNRKSKPNRPPSVCSAEVESRPGTGLPRPGNRI